MRFKNPKNKKSKLHIKFDEDDRREYLTGFRKRKLERKGQAKIQMAEKLKREKREIKKKRIDLIKKMLGARSENPFDNISDDEEEKFPTDEVENADVTEYDNCTVKVSNLDLNSKFLLGTKKSKTEKNEASSSKNSSEEDQLPLFKVPLDKIKSNKQIKTSIWKTASKKAKKTFESEKRNKKKKKKLLVTEL